MTLREEGYTEANGGPGFDLRRGALFRQLAAHRLGADFKTKVSSGISTSRPNCAWAIAMTCCQDPVKMKAAFESTGGRGTAGNTLHLCRPRS